MVAMRDNKQSTFEEKVAAVKAYEEEGVKMASLTEIFGVSQATIFRWVKRYRETGNFESLRSKHSGGRKRILGQEQTEKLLKLILKPASEYGFEDDAWTLKRVTILLNDHLGIKVSKGTVWRILRRNNFFYKKIETNYKEGSKEELDRWLEDKFPKIQAEVRKKQGILYFLDESNIQLSACRGKSWAPKGARPSSKISGKRGSLSAISAISKSGYLVFDVHETRINSDKVIDFFKKVLAHHPRRHIFILLDNAAVHTAKKIKEFEDRNKRLHIEYLPKYWPKYNPDEFVWNYLKNVEMKIYSAQDKAELKGKVRKKLNKIKNNQNVLMGIFFRCKLADFMK